MFTTLNSLQYRADELNHLSLRIISSFVVLHRISVTMHNFPANIPSVWFMVLWHHSWFHHSFCLVLRSDVCLISAPIAAPTQGSVLGCEDLDNANIAKVMSDSVVSALVPKHSTPLPEVDQEKAEEAGMPRQNSELRHSQPKGELPWSNVDLAEMKAASANAAEKSVAVYPMELGGIMKQEERPPWAWITAGQCEIDSNTNISWLEIPGT